MAYLALYRLFRPTTLDGIVKQEHIIRILSNQIQTGRVGHAYLFCGPRGTGKTSTAKIFAKAINCQSPVNASPCGKCDSCKALSEGSSLDVIEIDAASNNGVNEMRDLREKVQYPPVNCNYKVYIIDEVHMLSDSAFNALLKTLEEPPAHAVFILATTEPQKIPATILSRCMRFDFKLIPQTETENHLKEIFKKIGKEYEDEAVTLIAKAGAGSMRDSLSIADICISYSSGKLTYDDVNFVLGVADFYDMLALIKNILSFDTSSACDKLEKILASGKGVGTLSKDILQFINNCAIVKMCKNAEQVLNLPSERYNELLTLVENIDGHALLRITEIFTAIDNSLRYSSSPKIILETAVIKASMPETDYNIDALISRVTRLENVVKGGIKIVETKSTADNVNDKKENAVRENTIKEQNTEKSSFEEKKVESIISEKSSVKTFGLFLRALRSNVKNGVLFTMCSDLENAYQNDTFVLIATRKIIYDSLLREDNYNVVKSAFESIGIYDFKIIMKGEKTPEVDNGLNVLKNDFSDIEIEIK